MKTKIQFRKLDMRGFAHQIGMLAFVVIFAVVGVGYLVATHAQTNCRMTTALGSPVVCDPVSGPASSPTSSPVIAGSCTIEGVPANPGYGLQLAPTVTFKNTGNQSFSTTANGQVEVSGDNSTSKPDYPSTPIKAVTVGPGQTVTIDTGIRYTVGYTSKGIQKVSFSVSNSTPAFSCSASASLPAVPVTPVPVPPKPTPPPTRLAGACRISGVPVRPYNKQVIRPTVAVTNIGSVEFQPKLVESLQIGSRTTSKTHTLSLLKPQSAARKSLTTYTTQRHSGKTTQGIYRVISTQPSFSCSATFRLP